MREFMNGRIIVKVGDITKETVDAIVNAANSSLMGGGGVDGAIHRAGGPTIKEECAVIRKERYPGGLPTGQAVTTGAGRLPAEHVVHTVGPIWRGGGDGEDDLLRDCYRNSLAEAQKRDCKTVAFPAVSTGVYGFPRERAAKIASETVWEFLECNDAPGKVVFVFFSEDDAALFLEHCRF